MIKPEPHGGVWNPDPITLRDNKWFFYDENWTEFAGGPYDTREEARIALNEYAKTLDDDDENKGK